MKKGVLLALLTYVGVAHCVNCLILSSHWSVTSKVITLMLFSFAYSSAGLLATLAWLGTCSTTKNRAGSNRLSVLRQAEERIALNKAGAKTMTIEDQWEELHEQDLKNNRKAKKCNGAYCWCASE